MIDMDKIAELAACRVIAVKEAKAENALVPLSKALKWGLGGGAIGGTSSLFADMLRGKDLDFKQALVSALLGSLGGAAIPVGTHYLLSNPYAKVLNPGSHAGRIETKRVTEAGKRWTDRQRSVAGENVGLYNWLDRNMPGLAKALKGSLIGKFSENKLRAKVQRTSSGTEPVMPERPTLKSLNLPPSDELGGVSLYDLKTRENRTMPATAVDRALAKAQDVALHPAVVTPLTIILNALKAGTGKRIAGGISGAGWSILTNIVAHHLLTGQKAKEVKSEFTKRVEEWNRMREKRNR